MADQQPITSPIAGSVLLCVPNTLQCLAGSYQPLRGITDDCGEGPLRVEPGRPCCHRSWSGYGAKRNAAVSQRASDNSSIPAIRQASLLAATSPVFVCSH